MRACKCASCGKPFHVYGEAWGYYYGADICCSYHCMRKMRWEDMNYMSEKEKKNTRSHWPVEDRQTALRMRAEGRTLTEIAEAMNRSQRSVQQWLWKHSETPTRNATAKPLPDPVQTESVLEEPIIKEPIKAEAPAPEKAPEPAEAVIPAAPKKQAPVIDRARIISVLCDITEQLIAILREECT